MPLPGPGERIDTLVLPGGSGCRAASGDPELIAFVRAAASRCRRVAAVCTGAFIAAAAGLLWRVTTHWAAAQELAAGHAYAADLSDEEERRSAIGRRALSYCGKALRLQRESGNRLGEAATLDSLGYCCHQTGHYTQAIAYYQQALPAYADAGDRYFRAQTLIHLGETHQANEDQEAASDVWQQAMAILNDLHHPDAALIRAKLRGLTAPTLLPCD